MDAVSHRTLGGGCKTKEISMKSSGVKVVKTKEILKENNRIKVPMTNKTKSKKTKTKKKQKTKSNRIKAASYPNTLSKREIIRISYPIAPLSIYYFITFMNYLIDLTIIAGVWGL